MGTLDKEVERQKYIKIWEFDKYREYSPGEDLVSGAIQFINPGSSVIDFGCGTGRAAAKLVKSGYRVLGIDFAPNCLDKNINIPLLVADLTELPTLIADFGYCCDVMEHIPTHYVNDVLSGIARSVKAAFFSIALQMDSSGKLIGERLHLTVQPVDWWREKLQQHFSSVECDDRGYSLIAVCRH